jgi:hypothetical protein
MQTNTMPAYGSVDYYADLLRDCATNGGFTRLDSLTIHFLDDVANAKFHEGADRLGRVRNVLTARELVAEEIRAARR